MNNKLLNRQMVDFTIITQEDGTKAVIKYMLGNECKAKNDNFKVIVEKYTLGENGMEFSEEETSIKSYNLDNALKLSKDFTAGQVTPYVFHEVERDYCLEGMCNCFN